MDVGQSQSNRQQRQGRSHCARTAEPHALKRQVAHVSQARALLGQKALTYKQKHHTEWYGVFVQTGNFLSSQAASSQVLSTFRGLTTVFGMGTGGSPQLSPPDCIQLKAETLKTSQKRKQTISLSLRSFKSSPRHISTGQLNALLQLHTRPINLIFFKVSYQITL